MNETQERYVFIDGMRAIAALLVCTSHINDIVQAETVFGHLRDIVRDKIGIDISRITVFISNLFQHGHKFGDMGLDMFFVISGFLITNILLKRSERQLCIKNFYLRRFFKIIPSYTCVVLVCLYLNFTNTPLSFKQEISTVAQYFLFLQNYFVQLPALRHTWSLVVEEHFYIIYPIILWLIFKYSSKEKKKFYLIGACLVVIFLVNLQRGIYHYYGTTFLYNIWTSPNIEQTTTFRVDALAFGCLLCVLKEYWAHRAPFILGWLFIILSMVGFSIFLGTSHTNPIYYPLDYSSAGLLMAGIYITGFRWGVENRFLVSIGRSSYNMYLWHYLFLQYLLYWVAKYDALIVIPAYYCIFILAGALATHYIERPFLRLGRKIIQRGMLHAGR